MPTVKLEKLLQLESIVSISCIARSSCPSCGFVSLPTVSVCLIVCSDMSRVSQQFSTYIHMCVCRMYVFTCNNMQALEFMSCMH